MSSSALGSAQAPGEDRPWTALEGRCPIEGGGSWHDALVWPGCGLEHPPYQPAARCVAGWPCARACRQEIGALGAAPEFTTDYFYGADGRLIRALQRGPRGEEEDVYTYRAGMAQTRTWRIDGRTRASVQYRYDGARLIEAAEGESLTTEFAYDSSGRLTSMRAGQPDGRVLSKAYDYDEAGRLASVGDDLDIARYRYDDLGRLASIQRGDDWSVTYQYDRHGRLTEAVDASSRRSYVMDAEGRLIEVRIGPPTAPPYRSIRYQYECGR